nr:MULTISPECIES: hypothetical protein [unclassified Marinobacter]
MSELATRIAIPLGRLSSFGNQTMQGLTPEVSVNLLPFTLQLMPYPKNNDRTDVY